MSDDDIPPPRRPLLIELDEAAPADPGLAPPVPEAGVSADLVPLPARQQGLTLARALIWALGALFSFALSVAAYDFVASLMASSPWLGWVALVLTGVATGLALVFAAREWIAYLRLSLLDKLRVRAIAARQKADLHAARIACADVASLYRHRPEAEPALQRLRDLQSDVLDADALIDLTEQELLAPLDLAARREIETAARQVATITALVPMALADVATALFANLRMIRRIAQLYGGRSGRFASFGLLRRVFTYLVATGAVALTDDLIGSVAGGGVLSKISRRFGEGVVNGALTARIGVAAMELCRPLPFHALRRPQVTNLMGRALAGVFDRSPAARAATGQAES